METPPEGSQDDRVDDDDDVVARVTARPATPPPAERAGRLLGRSVAKAKSAITSPRAQDAGKRAATTAATKYFARAKGPVGKLVANKGKLLNLASRGEGVAGRLEGSGPRGQAGEDMRTLLRLIRAYASGDYRDVSLESMGLVVAAVAYVVSPLDFIPDFVPGIGGLDDLTVLGFALKAVRQELDEFLAWEAGQDRPEPLPPKELPPG